MYVLAFNTMLPDGARFNAPVLVIVTPVPTMLLVLMLAAVMLPETDTTAPVWLATFTMLVNMPLLAVILPVTDTTAPV